MWNIYKVYEQVWIICLSEAMRGFRKFFDVLSLEVKKLSLKIISYNQL